MSMDVDDVLGGGVGGGQAIAVPATMLSSSSSSQPGDYAAARSFIAATQATTSQVDSVLDGPVVRPMLPLLRSLADALGTPLDALLPFVAERATENDVRLAVLAAVQDGRVLTDSMTPHQAAALARTYADIVADPDASALARRGADHLGWLSYSDFY
jgi:hypothetical protein